MAASNGSSGLSRFRRRQSMTYLRGEVDLRSHQSHQIEEFEHGQAQR